MAINFFLLESGQISQSSVTSISKSNESPSQVSIDYTDYSATSHPAVVVTHGQPITKQFISFYLIMPSRASIEMLSIPTEAVKQKKKVQFLVLI